MLVMLGHGKVKTILIIGASVVSNTNVIFLHSIMLLIMNTLPTCFPAKVYPFIFAFEITPIKAQVLTTISSANIHRALTRLKSVFITLQGTEGAWNRQSNDFFHPISMKATDAYSVSDGHQYQVQIGSKLIPEYPGKSLSESLSQLRKLLVEISKCLVDGIVQANTLLGSGLKKVSGAGFTGMSAKSGDRMSLKFRDCDVADLGGSVPPRVFCALNYDVVLNISDNGVQVLC